MEFNQELLSPGTPLDHNSPLFKILESNLLLVLSQMKARLADVANSQKFDFRPGECRVGEKERFIGAMVTQFTGKGDQEKNSLNHLVHNVGDFLVCLKSDGVRYLLVLTNKGEAYLVDRMNNLFEVNLDLTGLVCDPLGAEETLIEHILDGELIYNQTGFATAERLHFHLFDCLLYKRALIIDRNYVERIECCQSLLAYNKFFASMEPKADKSFPPDRIYIYVKDFYAAKSTAFLLEKLSELPAFKDKIDGLIFTKISYPYYPGRNQGIVKWKPDFLNTIDFLVVENREFVKHSPSLFQGDDLFVFELYCSLSGNMLLFDYMFVFDVDKYIDIQKELKPFSILGRTVEGAIIECKYDKGQRHPKLDKFYQLFYEMDSELIQGLVRGSTLGGPTAQDPTAINTLLGSMQKRAAGEDECHGNWVAIRVRSDKSFPNGFVTARNVFGSIFEDNISQKLLLAKIEEGMELLTAHRAKKIRNNR